MPPEESPETGPGSVVEFRRTNTTGKIEDPNTRRFSVQVGTKFLGSKDLRREIHSSMHKSKKLSDNLRTGVHSEEDSKNNSEHNSRAESSADSFDDKKSKTCSPDPLFQSPKSEKVPEEDEEESIELTRRKSQRSAFIAKNLISLHLEEAEKVQQDNKITITIHKESTTFSDESIDAKSCPGMNVLRLDSMSDNSLNESYTSNTNSEKSANYNFTNEKRVPTPVSRKSRFWNQKDIKQEPNEDDNDNDDAKSCIGITTSREEPTKKVGKGFLRRTKTGLDNEDEEKSGSKGSPFMDDEEVRNVFKELTKLKIIKEKKKQVIEAYNLIGMKAKTMLNQVPYVKGTLY